MTAVDEAGAAIRSLLGDGADQPTWAAFVPWLVREAAPDDRHRVLLGWNWDEGTAVPSWIVHRPDCDAATALLAFWNATPDEFVDELATGEPGGALEADLVALARDVRARWLAGAYVRRELAFSLDDAATWPRDFAELDERYGERARIAMPLAMRDALAGRTIDDDGYVEGIPSRFWPEGSR